MMRSKGRELKATHLVLFENQDFWSSRLGDRKWLFVGPTCTSKSPEELDGHWLGDQPSQRLYPVAAVSLGDGER